LPQRDLGSRKSRNLSREPSVESPTSPIDYRNDRVQLPVVQPRRGSNHGQRPISTPQAGPRRPYPLSHDSPDALSRQLSHPSMPASNSRNSSRSSITRTVQSFTAAPLATLGFAARPEPVIPSLTVRSNRHATTNLYVMEQGEINDRVGWYFLVHS